MNDQTTKLIEQLSEKLGTTAEYLWAVLIRQARIDALIDVVYFVLIIIFGIVLWKVHKYLSKPTKEGGYSIYHDQEEMAIITMVVLASLWGLLFIVYLSSIGDIIIGFFHPEYWALKEILEVIKK